MDTQQSERAYVDANSNPYDPIVVMDEPADMLQWDYDHQRASGLRYPGSVTVVLTVPAPCGWLADLVATVKP